MGNDTNYKILKIYFSSTDKVNCIPLYEVIAKQAKEFGMEGATVHRAMMGFGPSTRLRSARYFELVEKFPVVLEIIEEAPKVDAFAKAIRPVLENQPKGCLMAVQEIDVLFKKQGTKTQE